MNTPNFEPDRLAARKARLVKHAQMLRDLAQAFEKELVKDDMGAYEDEEFSKMLAHLMEYYLRALSYLVKD